ncbi:MAG: tRNA (N(6)-L-threonylcarbamoyladenosine(37)-C(2))-methylthiotransferase MtaB [Clostridia bacterium]|nr:tRNA (N(6)-L-threonylcarbamoyladenosine(37)-C(2))-methylthiotransferase MtaB [Clostridia bacterium]
MSFSYTAAILTLGCKVNQYESEAMAEALAEQGVTLCAPTERCDLYLINTCTVTAESDRKARQFIRRVHALNPNARIVVTGCLAQTDPDSLVKILGVDAVVGNTKKMEAVSIGLSLLRQGCAADAPFCAVYAMEGTAFEPMQITRFDRTRAYVKIEDGCENRCTYCIIPAARGQVRSKPPQEVIDEVMRLTEGGCREVVLTGIETASYGKDLSPACSLGDLLGMVNAIPNVGRIRLGSLDPSSIRPAFAQALPALSALAPHFHLSLQSGSDRILAAMKRKYNSAMAMEAIRRLRLALPRVQFTTDVIVGFPGETEEDFEKTLQFIREARFLQVHIFPYSKRAGTPAASMSGQISKEEKSRRLHVLSDEVARIRRSLLEEMIEKEPLQTVLFETMDHGFAIGHTDHFAEVAVPSEHPLHARLCRVRLTHTDGLRCYGERVERKEVTS